MKRNAVVVLISIFAMALLLTSVFCLVFTQQEQYKNEYDLYLSGLIFNPNNMTVKALVSFSGNQAQKINCPVATRNNSEEKGFWFSTNVNTYSIKSKELAVAVGNMLQDEDLINDGITYDKANLIYEFRYVTQYKSIEGGNTQIIQNVFVHSFSLDKNSNVTQIELSNRFAETANWYSVLVVFGILITGVAVGAVCYVKRKK